MLLEDHQVLASGKQLAIDVKEEWSSFRCGVSRVRAHILCRERARSNLADYAAASAPPHHSPYYGDMTVCGMQIFECIVRTAMQATVVGLTRFSTQLFVHVDQQWHTRGSHGYYRHDYTSTTTRRPWLAVAPFAK
jgi:hypothetical protein